MICDEDLGDAACDAIQALDGVDADAFVVLTAAAAVDAMSAEEVPYDAWATLDPWPQILDEGRTLDQLSSVAGGAGVPVASSPLAFLTYDRKPVDCGVLVQWDCLLDTDVTDIGVPDLDTAAGPLVLGAAAMGNLGVDFGIDDASEGEARVRLTTLLDSAPSASMAQRRPRWSLRWGASTPW